MKLKSFLWTIGMKPRPRTYGTRRLQFSLAGEGRIEYAKWLHPKDYFRPFDQQHVDDFDNGFERVILQSTSVLTRVISLCHWLLQPARQVLPCLRT